MGVEPRGEQLLSFQFIRRLIGVDQPCPMPELVHHFAVHGRVLANVESGGVQAEYGDLVEPGLHLVRGDFDIAIFDEHIADEEPSAANSSSVA